MLCSEMTAARSTGRISLLIGSICLINIVHAANGVAVIGHAGLAPLDPDTLAQIYLGKVIQVDGIAVTPVNASSGSSVRDRFLQVFLNEDEYKYQAYWTDRRYSGKGASPRELRSSTDIIRFVKSTPGAIGYIDEADLPPDANVLAK